jgi:hypothetical protein
LISIQKLTCEYYKKYDILYDRDIFGENMSKVPFGRFITTFLLFNKDISYIVDKLKGFGYQVTDDIVQETFDALKAILPEKYQKIIENRGTFDSTDPDHAQWLKQLGVFEFYDFIIRKKSVGDDPPEYFKWCEDCMWVHGYKEAMILINILMFNDEPFEGISKVISFKYKKRISASALELYKNVFWNTELLTAKEALYYCIPFQKNALVIRHIRSGGMPKNSDGQEVEMLGANETNDGSDVPFTFHDAQYIKWKVGYRDVSAPTSKDFMENIKKDSYYKYYETMSMTQSIEIDEEDEDGHNEKVGDFNSRKIKIKKRNVEEQRSKMAKGWLDIYLKADAAIPTGGESETSFFDRMDQLELGFDDEKEELARVEDVPDAFEDIKSDMSP